MSTHRCPGPGCDRQVSATMLACRRHWFQVSEPVRTEVWRAWRALLRSDIADDDAERRHTAAMDAAIAEMKP